MLCSVVRRLSSLRCSFRPSSPLCSSRTETRRPWLNHCLIRPCTSFSGDGDGDGKEESESQDTERDAAYEGLVAEQQLYPAVPHSGHSVLVLQPKIKWGRNKKTNTTPELQLEEAIALVGTLPGWRVVQSFVVPTDYNTKKKRVWGSGKIDELKRLVGRTSATALMINADMLNPTQQKELYEAFHLPVYDRYTTVMLIFKAYAATKEAFLQIQLAEIPYLRKRLQFMTESNFAHAAIGAGLTGVAPILTQGGHAKRLEVLKLREHRLQKKLSVVLADRQAKRDERLSPRGRQQTKKPTIAVIGYTNAGKTSLIRCLTGDERLRPEDRLFATLDTTVYSGKLPSQMPVYYADTIGFISNLPHSLIASFTATLDDVRHAHLLVHVRDIAHPDTVAQRDEVLATLHNLRLPAALIENMIEARNKFDRITDKGRIGELEEETGGDANSNANAILTSCTTGRGLQQLSSLIERRIFKLIGCVARKFKLPIDSPAVSYFYREVALLSDPAPSPCGRFLFFTAAMDDIQFEKFQTQFGAYRKQSSTSDRE